PLFETPLLLFVRSRRASDRQSDARTRARAGAWRPARLGAGPQARAFTLPLGLPLVPALEEGASKCAVEQVEHQQGGRGFLVDLDPLGVEREDREDVAVPPVTLRRPGADVARHPGVVFELKGALRKP